MYFGVKKKEVNVKDLITGNPSIKITKNKLRRRRKARPTLDGTIFWDRFVI